MADKPINEWKRAFSLGRKLEILVGIEDGLSDPGSNMVVIRPAVFKCHSCGESRRLTEVLLVVTDYVEWREPLIASAKRL